MLYVHPGSSAATTLEVEVGFRGGLLTQFYPQAEVVIPGLRRADGRCSFAPLAATTLGTLRWPAVQIGGDAVPPPVTTAPLWLAPRQVEAASLTVGKEGERYLFYRGIGHLDAPVRVMRSAQGELTIQAESPSLPPIATFWLVDIGADGTLAFRTVDNGHDTSPIAAGADTFPASAYTISRRTDLRLSLHAGLMGEGLFADEAEAMLNTWDASYFRTPGLRLFFLTPRVWTDHVLPLTVTPAAAVERALVGRIELISPAQRAGLARIDAGPTSNTIWFNEVMTERIYDFSLKEVRLRAHGQEVMDELYANRPGAFARLGLAVPADYQAFLALGRFREALLNHVLAHQPAPGLVAFAKAYGLVRN